MYDDGYCRGHGQHILLSKSQGGGPCLTFEDPMKRESSSYDDFR